MAHMHHHLDAILGNGSDASSHPMLVPSHAWLLLHMQAAVLHMDAT